MENDEECSPLIKKDGVQYVQTQIINGTTSKRREVNGTIEAVMSVASAGQET